MSKQILFKKKLFKGEHWQIHKNISSSLSKQTLACLRLKLQKKYWSLFNSNTFCKKNENFNRISTGYTTKLGTFHSISFSFHSYFPLWNRAAFSAATLLAYYILLQLLFGAIFVYMLSPGRIVLCFHLSKIDENRWQRTFFDERNLDPNNQRHENKLLKRYLETNEQEKKRDITPRFRT